MADSIAVIIPNYNRSHFLARALESVHLQSYPHWRCYIVDDGSENPASLSVARRWLRLDKRMLLLRQGQRGVSAARNLAIFCSREPWIALLDSDDQWHSDKLAICLEYAQQNPDRLWHSNESWIRRGSFVNQGKRHSKGGGEQFFRSLELCVISPSASFFHRNMLSLWGVFDESFTVAEDFDLWLRATSISLVGYIDQPLTIKHGGHADQLSKTPLIDLFRCRAIAKTIRFGLNNHSTSLQRKISKSIADPQLMLKASRQQLAQRLTILKCGALKRSNKTILAFVAKMRSSFGL